jgi:hypothetical protein
MGGSGSGETTNIPWGAQGKEFRKLYEEADKLLGNQIDYFPGSTVAPRNAWQTGANENVANLVQGGSAGLDSALAENQRTTSGQYLDVGSNPWLRGVGDAAASDISRQYNQSVMPQIASRFGGAGRSAGPNDANNAEGVAMSAANRDLGQELSQMYAGLYAGAYETERGRMVQGTGIAPTLRNAQFQDQAALQAAGRDEFQYAQMQLTDLVNRFNFEQYEPYESLGLYQGLINQPGGGYGTQTQKASMGGAQIGGMAASLAGSLGSAYIGTL